MIHLWKIITNSPVLRVIVLFLFFSGMGIFALWDCTRVDENFPPLKTLLTDNRYRAVKNNETQAVWFVDKQVIVTDRKTGKAIKSLNVQTLDQVNYDTTLGDGIIVFDGHGTSAYNKRIHGGGFRLESWLGFQKNIAVNCTGLVTEGVYPAEGGQ